MHSPWVLTGRRPQFLVGFSTVAAGFLRNSNQESVRKEKVTIFCNLITEVSSHHLCYILLTRGMVKSLPANAGDERDTDLIPGLGRSPGEGRGNPLQYSCPEHPIKRRAWQAMVHRVTKSWTPLKQLSVYTHTHTHTHAVCINGILYIANIHFA